MNWIIDNWYIAFGIVALIVTVIYSLYKFAGLPTKEQTDKIKEWLLLAVIEAEAELGAGTGKVKLRYVYDLFISKFPVAAKVVSFGVFSHWVDEALVEMRRLLEVNGNIYYLVVDE